MKQNIAVSIKAKLIEEQEIEQRLETFVKALNDLPKTLNIDITVGSNVQTGLRVSLEDLVLDLVKKHFKRQLFSGGSTYELNRFDLTVNGCDQDSCDTATAKDLVNKLNIKRL